MSDRSANFADNVLAPTLEPLLEDYSGDTVRRAFDHLKALRFRAVQLSATQPGMRPRDLDGSARRDLMASLRRRELTVAGLDLWIPSQHFIQPSTSDRAVNAVQQAIELAADLGRVALSLNLPAFVESDGSAAQLKLIADVISAHSDKCGVPVANHTAPNPPISQSSIGVGIDPAAWIGLGQDPAAALLANARQLVSVRLCDLLRSGIRAPVGTAHEGQLDLTQFRVAISIAQYAGPLVVDARQWSDPWSGLERSRAAWTG